MEPQVVVLLAAESEEGGADEEADMQAISAIAQALIATKITLQGTSQLQICSRFVSQLTLSHLLPEDVQSEAILVELETAVFTFRTADFHQTDQSAPDEIAAVSGSYPSPSLPGTAIEPSSSSIF